MKPFNSLSKTSGVFAVLSMFITITALPSTAAARSSVHIDLPHFSVGLNDNHHGKGYRNSHRNRHYNKKWHGSRHSNRHYKKRHHNNSYYGDSYNSGSYNNYYNGHSSYGNTRRYYKPRNYRYNRNYGGEYCPTPGYSSDYYEDRSCYSHGDHYHCDG
tara:strand:+ start:474 stop:947 length:474 start_codon:yes stop_codon:yes gene_type:complete